ADDLGGEQATWAALGRFAICHAVEVLVDACRVGIAHMSVIPVHVVATLVEVLPEPRGVVEPFWPLAARISQTCWVVENIPIPIRAVREINGVLAQETARVDTQISSSIEVETRKIVLPNRELCRVRAGRSGRGCCAEWFKRVLRLYDSRYIGQSQR